MKLEAKDIEAVLGGNDILRARRSRRPKRS